MIEGERLCDRWSKASVSVTDDGKSLYAQNIYLCDLESHDMNQWSMPGNFADCKLADLVKSIFSSVHLYVVLL